jgi:hypothetical protein
MWGRIAYIMHVRVFLNGYTNPRGHIVLPKAHRTQPLGNPRLILLPTPSSPFQHRATHLLQCEGERADLYSACAFPVALAPTVPHAVADHRHVEQHEAARQTLHAGEGVGQALACQGKLTSRKQCYIRRMVVFGGD